MPSENTLGLKNILSDKKLRGIWWRLLRPHTLTASFVPVFVGTMLAWRELRINLWLFLAMLIAAMLIQSATNFFNEYFDFKRGLDHAGSVGIGGTIVRDGIKPQIILRLGFLFFFIAMLLGCYICMASSWWLAVVGLAAMLVGYLYTGGPYPIAYTPFGELVAGLLMGTLIIGISYYIQTLAVSSGVLLVSIPIALFIGCLLLANNIRDREGDLKSGRRTMAILLGHQHAVWLQTAVFVLIYLLTALYILIGLLPWWSVIAMLSAVVAVKAIRGYKANATPMEMMPAMVATGQCNTIYGLLLGLSLMIDAMV